MMKKNSVGSAKKTKSVKQAVAAVNANFKEDNDFFSFPFIFASIETFPEFI